MLSFSVRLKKYMITIMHKFDRGSGWWGVFVCIPHADGTFPERVFLH